VSTSLKTYRVYCYDGSEMTLTGGLIEASSDAEAIAVAETAAIGSKCELWDGARLVAQFGAERRLA